MAYKNKISGVYKITNLINNKCYIGSSVHIYSRWNCHKTRLNNFQHHSPHLQNSWKKHGGDHFNFEILAKCPPEKEYLLRLEQWFIDNVKPEYNINPNSSSCLGIKYSEERRRKQSIASTGRVVSLETREKLKKSNTGKKQACKARALISKAQKEMQIKDPIKYSLRTAKLTPDQVRDIKLMLSEGKRIIDCARKYNMSRCPIELIKSGKTWKYITI